MAKAILNHTPKHHPPAYYRYREKNVTVSVVLSKNTKEVLDKARGDKSYSQFIKSLFSEDGLFSDLQKQKAAIQELRSEVDHEKKGLEAQRRQFEQEMADSRHRASVELQNARNQIVQEAASLVISMKDDAFQSGYSQGEKAGFAKGILKGKEQGRQFYLGFCLYCGAPILWDLNTLEDIKNLERLASQVKLAHVSCEEKAQKAKAHLEYLGSAKFVPL